MSKNFKNTTFINHDEPDLDIAWREMRKTLDQKLPVKKDHRSRRLFIYFFRVAAVLLLILGTLLPLTIYNLKDNRQAKLPAQKRETINNSALNNQDQVISNTTLYDIGIKQLNKSGEDTYAALSFNNILSQKKPFSSMILQNKNGRNNSESYSLNRQLTEKKNDRKRIHGNPLLFESDSKYSITQNEKRYINSEIRESEKLLLAKKNTLNFIDTSLKSSVAVKNDEQKKKKRSIGFEIGAYYNIGGSLSAIYPIAAITIPVSKKIFLSLGLGLNSQVKINNFNPKEFTVLNDTINQAYFTVEQKNIKKAVYLDVPVSINYKINKRITVNAGVQLSVLRQVDVNAEEKTFDFQADLSQQIASPVYTTASSVTPYQVYAQDYTVMKTNGRFIAGVSYQFKNMGIKFQYQQSFTPNYRLIDFNGNKSEKQLSVFTLGLTYRIR